MMDPSLLPSLSVGYSLHVAKVDETDRVVVADKYVPSVRVGVEGAVHKELPGVHLEDEGDDPVGVQGKSRPLIGGCRESNSCHEP